MASMLDTRHGYSISADEDVLDFGSNLGQNLMISITYVPPMTTFISRSNGDCLVLEMYFSNLDGKIDGFGPLVLESSHLACVSLA